VEFERRVEKFPYQLSEIFELFLPPQEFRNNGYADVAQAFNFFPRVFRSTSFRSSIESPSAFYRLQGPTSSFLKYSGISGSYACKFHISHRKPVLFDEFFYFILFKNCRKEDPAVLPSKRAGAYSTLDIARSKSPFQILN
jgi:hypothetical protein